MEIIRTVVIAVFLLFVFIKTVSYAVWVWKQKNRLGSVAVFLLALMSLAVPIYGLVIHYR